MGTYTVIVEEVVTQSFAVGARSQEEALELARARYRGGEYVLEPGEVQDVRLCVTNENGEVTLWEDL